jgi:hypothetical protein
MLRRLQTVAPCCAFRDRGAGRISTVRDPPPFLSPCKPLSPLSPPAREGVSCSEGVLLWPHTSNSIGTMLEVGNPPGGTGESPAFENVRSWRAHFGAWAITSSPLLLSFDLTNKTKVWRVRARCLFVLSLPTRGWHVLTSDPCQLQMDLVWDIITNREALAINSKWAGEAGRLVNSTYDTTGPTPLFARPCSTLIDTQRFVLGPNRMLRSASMQDHRCVTAVMVARHHPPDAPGGLQSL